MTDRNSSWFYIKSVQGLTSKITRSSAIALSTMLGGMLVATSSHAIEPAPSVPTVSHELATIDPAASSLRKDDTPKIDLEGVRDLRSIIDEARKRAQIKYLAKKLRKPEQSLAEYVQLAWEEAAQREWLEPELLIAIMEKESTFRPKVQSRYGAQGLMQVVPRWHRDKVKASESLFNPEVNVRVGTDILEEYLAHADGDLAKALAKYSGNARGYADKVISESRKLARVGDRAAAQVAMAPNLFSPIDQAG